MVFVFTVEDGKYTILVVNVPAMGIEVEGFRVK